MKLTLVYPCMGKIPGKPYVRSWQMQPLPAAHLAGLTPKDVEIQFWDDRMEPIPFDEPTDLVAIFIETYTAKRAYQIASEFRKRGVPVVMGGFHATLVPEEVLQYAETVVIGEAEQIWSKVIEDFKAGRLQRRYQAKGRPNLIGIMPDRNIFKGKSYLPVSLIEAGRGCPRKCDFCSIQTVFDSSQNMRDTDSVIKEIKSIQASDKGSNLFFFVDDNIVSHLAEAKELFRALIPLKIKWVSQASIDMAFDDELLELMKKSGCLGVLIGFESLNKDNLASMNKMFNSSRGGIEEAMTRLNRKGILLYATFVFGYEADTIQSFQDTIDFCIRHKIFMVAFNHCTPFPGTPLYARLKSEGKLLYDKWWLDDRYRYGQVPYQTSMPSKTIQDLCVKARKKFYSPVSIFKRLWSKGNIQNPRMIGNYLFINFLLWKEASQRENYPLGDAGYTGELLKVTEKLSASEYLNDSI